MERQQFTCDADGCPEPVIFHLTWARMRSCLRERHFCDQHAKAVYDSYCQDKPVGGGDPAVTEGARCFEIELVMICETHEKQLLVVREVGGTRSIPILTGVSEAWGIVQKLKRWRSPWPSTHDAMLDAIRALGGVLEDVWIDDVKDQTYYAKLRIRQNDQLILIDTRPSDAFVVALKADAPIFFTDEVLAKIDA